MLLDGKRQLRCQKRHVGDAVHLTKISEPGEPLLLRRIPNVEFDHQLPAFRIMLERANPGTSQSGGYRLADRSEAPIPRP